MSARRNPLDMARRYWNLALAAGLMLVAAKMVLTAVLICRVAVPSVAPLDLNARQAELTRATKATYLATHQEPCAATLAELGSGDYWRCKTGVGHEEAEQISLRVYDELGKNLRPFAEVTEAKTRAVAWTLIVAPLLYLLASFLLPFQIGRIFRAALFGIPAAGCALASVMIGWGGLYGVPVTGGLILAAVLLAWLTYIFANVEGFTRPIEAATKVAHTRRATPRHIHAYGITSNRQRG